MDIVQISKGISDHGISKRVLPYYIWFRQEKQLTNRKTMVINEECVAYNEIRRKSGWV